MLLITYATHNSGYLNALKKSSAQNGFELIVLGENTKWKGFMQRILDIMKFLRTKNQNEIVCVVDGFDVFTLGTSDEFLQKFKSFNTDKVIFSTTKDNHFSNILFGKVNPNDSNYEYNRLNAGIYVGYCGKIIELFENVCKFQNANGDADDQEKLTKCYMNCKDCLLLDHENSLFYCIETSSGFMYYMSLILQKPNRMESNNQYYFMKDNRIVIKKNNMKPVFVQGNGNLDMDVLAKQLNLPLKLTDNRNYFDYSTKGFIFKIVSTYVGYIVLVIHSLCMGLLLGLPFITNNIYLLLLLIVMYVGITTQWYVMDGCYTTQIENALFYYDDDSNAERKSVWLQLVEPYVDTNRVSVMFSLLPFILSIYSAYKIVNILQKKNIPLRFSI
jgi:hypothetical protein